MLQSIRTYRGMVAAPHHLASRAGLRVLEEGGNAIEAMVAAASTIAVVYPHMNSLGGDNIWLIHTPGKDVIGIDASEVRVRESEGRPPCPTREDVEASAAMSAGDRDRMIRSMVARLAEGLEENPGDLAGWKRLGRSYRVLGDARRARDAFARAAALDPDDAAALESYATAIAEAAPAGAPVPQEAVVVFRRLAERDRDNRAALWHLGLAEAESGNTAGARALWRRLLALLPPAGPDHAAVKRSIDRLPGAPSGG